MAQGRFSRFDVIITLVSFITLLLDVVTDLAVAVHLYLQLWILWGSLVLGFLVIPQVVMSIVSLKWHSTDGSLTCRTLLPHACLVAPFQRYLHVLSLGCKSASKGHPRDTDAALRKQNDASILRLFGAFLESAPQLLLQLSIMLLYPSNIHPLQVVSAVCSLVSAAWALTVHCDSSRLNYQTPNMQRFLATSIHLCWQLFMLTARVTALVVFTSIFYAWVCLCVGLHWLVMTACICWKGTDFGQGKWEKLLFHIASGFVYIFVYQNIHEGPSRSRMTPYYVAVFVENGLLFTMWLIYGKPVVALMVAAAVLIFGGFVLGCLCLVVYYRCLHPSGPNYLLSVGAKALPSHSQHRGSQLLQPKDNAHQQEGEPLVESSPVPKSSTLELCIETDTPKKGPGNAGDTTFVIDEARREALVSAWQSGMESSDSSSTSSLDAADCSLDDFNATARSGSLARKNTSHSEQNTSQSERSSASGKPRHADPPTQPQSAPSSGVSQSSVAGSILPIDYTLTPSAASPCPHSKPASEMEDEGEGAENIEGGGETVVTDEQQQTQRPRSKLNRQVASPDVETLPSKPSLQRHPSSTPTTKFQNASSKISVRSELSGGRLGRKKLRNSVDTVSLPGRSSRPDCRVPATSASSGIGLPGKSAAVVDRLSQSFDLEHSPLSSGDSAEQSSMRMVRPGDPSFLKVKRESMAPYPDVVESLLPDPQQPKLFLGSDDMYGDRAGGESMWGVSPNMSTNSSSQSGEQRLSLAVSTSRLPPVEDCSDNEPEPEPEPAHLQTEGFESLQPAEDSRHEVSLRDCSAPGSPEDAESPTDDNDPEISWSSMMVNENEWSGLNNLNALSPEESFCSFASNEPEKTPPNKHTGKVLTHPKNSPAVGGEEGAFSRCSTPSLARSHSTSSVYHEFSSAGVSPSPPPGMRTGSRLSRNHSWVNSPFTSQPWQWPADSCWPLECPSVDPAPPVEEDRCSHRVDPRELVIEMLMDQLKRTSLRSGHSSHLHPHGASAHVRSPSVPDERLYGVEAQILRRLISEETAALAAGRADPTMPISRSCRSDIDLMRQALDLIERERFPHRFRQRAPDSDSPEIYVSGQYRPPIVDQARETPPHPSASRALAGAHPHSRSQMNASLRQPSVPSASRSQPPSSQHRSGHHPSTAHSSALSPDMEAGSPETGSREGLYRYFVHSDSPIHTPLWNTPQSTPATTPSHRHLLHRYLTQNHVQAGLREQCAPSAESLSLRKPPSGIRDHLSPTLPAEQMSGNPPATLLAHGERRSGSLPGGVIAHAGRASDIAPGNPQPRDGRTSSLHPHSTATRTSGFVPHTLIPRAGRPAEVQCYTEKLEVVPADMVVTPDNPDSGMHSGTQSAASRRHPLQSLDNSPSLSPTSLTQQPIHPKPTPQTQGTVGSDRHKHTIAAGGRSGSGQSSLLTVHPGSPRHSSRSRPHSQGHRHSAERSAERNRQAATSGRAPDSQASAPAKSIDRLR